MNPPCTGPPLSPSCVVPHGSRSPSPVPPWIHAIPSSVETCLSMSTLPGNKAFVRIVCKHSAAPGSSSVPFRVSRVQLSGKHQGVSNTGTGRGGRGFIVPFKPLSGGKEKLLGLSQFPVGGARRISKQSAQCRSVLTARSAPRVDRRHASLHSYSTRRSKRYQHT